MGAMMEVGRFALYTVCCERSGVSAEISHPYFLCVALLLIFFQGHIVVDRVALQSSSETTCCVRGARVELLTRAASETCMAQLLL